MTNHKRILDEITDFYISQVQSGRKLVKMEKLKFILEGYDYERMNELRTLERNG